MVTIKGLLTLMLGRAPLHTPLCLSVVTTATPAAIVLVLINLALSAIHL